MKSVPDGKVTVIEERGDNVVEVRFPVYRRVDRAASMGAELQEVAGPPLFRLYPLASLIDDVGMDVPPRPFH